MPKITYSYNVPLAPFTSFGVGGSAEKLIEVHSTEELLDVLRVVNDKDIWLIGYGSNTLISDEGLLGLTIVIRGGKKEIIGNTVVADAGIWWDDIVRICIEKNLWGVELLSEIPGSLGAALFINITAYGQSIGPNVVWIDVWDPSKKETMRINENDLSWSYKSSVFQQENFNDLIILQACIKLSERVTTELTYQKAVDVAVELGLDINDLNDRRAIIIEARKRAGSLWNPKDNESVRTVGSFFRNPVVSAEQAEMIISYDESGKTADQVKNMNKVHGGDIKRVSAAHVMLASGFKRGQMIGRVKLNDQNLLKLEATTDSTAQDIYDAVTNIQKKCYEKVGVSLEPEARILGNFK